MNINHADLNPDNWIFTKNGDGKTWTAKIIDWGSGLVHEFPLPDRPENSLLKKEMLLTRKRKIELLKAALQRQTQ